jgi:hypothetical protein
VIFLLLSLSPNSSISPFIFLMFSLIPHLVSWNWNGSHPSGIAAEVKPGEVTVISHRGNEIKKTGDESNPAVHIERSGNDVVKTASELHVDEKAEAEGSSSNGNTNGDSSKPEEKRDEEKKLDEKKTEENKDDETEAQTGEKRKAEEQADAVAEKAGGRETGQQKEGDDAKKLKTSNGDAAPAPAKENGEKKKAGRPRGNGEKKGAKKEKRVPAVGQAQRKTRSQGKVE